MRHALSHWVIPGLLLLVASEVGAQPIRIGQSFSPHPLVTPEITAKNGEQYLSKRGFEKCGRDPDYVTDEPVLPLSSFLSLANALFMVSAESITCGR